MVNGDYDGKHQLRMSYKTMFSKLLALTLVRNCLVDFSLHFSLTLPSVSPKSTYRTNGKANL